MTTYQLSESTYLLLTEDLASLWGGGRLRATYITTNKVVPALLPLFKGQHND